MQLRNTQQRWGIVAIGLHWITAVIVIALFILGLWMVELSYYDAWYRRAPFIHKSTGILLFMLMLFRLVWRWQNTPPNALTSHTSFERKAAHITHILIYGLLFLVMLSGYLISTADGRSIDVFGLFEVPAVIYGFDKQEDFAGVIHLGLAISLISLVVLHTAAALKHHLVNKDSTLFRMLGK